MIRFAELGWAPAIIAFVVSVVFTIVCIRHLVKYWDKKNARRF